MEKGPLPDVTVLFRMSIGYSKPRPLACRVPVTAVCGGCRQGELAVDRSGLTIVRSVSPGGFLPFRLRTASAVKRKGVCAAKILHNLVQLEDGRPAAIIRIFFRASLVQTRETKNYPQMEAR
jgi:hypothetical protein